VNEADRIIFFDGVCGLCNRFVDRLLRIDRRGVFRFAPLQGSTAHDRLPAGLADALSSVVYLREGIVLTRSTAALRILIDLGGWRTLNRAWFIFPRSVRDAVYDWIARNRYRWFGKRETCRVPTQTERASFLP
jgi:predicted DCC family thiol-disulfide oxidoreductase YuxK